MCIPHLSHSFKEIIADSIESAPWQRNLEETHGSPPVAFHLLGALSQVMGAQFYDALVTIPGCDKNMPGMADVVTHFSVFHYRLVSLNALKTIIVCWFSLLAGCCR